LEIINTDCSIDLYPFSIDAAGVFELELNFWCRSHSGWLTFRHFSFSHIMGSCRPPTCTLCDWHDSPASDFTILTPLNVLFYSLYCNNQNIRSIVLQFVDNNVLVQVSCAVRSYLPESPEVRTGFVQSLTDYFVGIKCSSVIALSQRRYI